MKKYIENNPKLRDQLHFFIYLLNHQQIKQILSKIKWRTPALTGEEQQSR